MDKFMPNGGYCLCIVEEVVLNLSSQKYWGSPFGEKMFIYKIGLGIPVISVRVRTADFCDYSAISGGKANIEAARGCTRRNNETLFILCC